MMPQDRDLSQPWVQDEFPTRAEAEGAADEIDNGHNRITVEQTHAGAWIIVEWE